MAKLSQEKTKTNMPALFDTTPLFAFNAAQMRIWSAMNETLLNHMVSVQGRMSCFLQKRLSESQGLQDSLANSASSHTAMQALVDFSERMMEDYLDCARSMGELAMATGKGELDAVSEAAALAAVPQKADKTAA